MTDTTGSSTDSPPTQGSADGNTYAVALLRDGFGRIDEGVHAVLDGLTAEELLWRPDAAANPIAWLVWHLSRQQDGQIADLARVDSPWSTVWTDRFALPYDREAHGYAMSSEEVGRFSVTDPELLEGYFADVHAMTIAWLDTLAPTDWDRVVDRNWEPPVTLAVRTISVLDDSAKHLGQAEYVRGLVLRRR